MTLAFLADHPVETARILEHEKSEQLAAFIAQLDPETVARALAPMPPEVTANCLRSVPPAACVAIIKYLPIHASGALMRNIGRDRRDTVLAELPGPLAVRLRRLSGYPADSAGACAEPDALAVSEDTTVGNVIARARRAPESIRKYVYVLDDRQRLIGTVDARQFFLASRAARIGALAEHDPISVRALASLNEVAGLPAWKRFDVLPVVDRGNTYIGALRRAKLEQALESKRNEPANHGLTETAAELADHYWDAATSMLHGSRQ